VLAAVGARRCGKSTAVMHLVYQMFSRFDLVVAFVGSAACSPCLEAMMERNKNWDTRFFFSSWNQVLIDKLLLQQENLKRRGIDRHVLILMDDVILTSKDQDSLAHMCLRGRHFNVSVIMAAVSYTSVPKRARRSLDFLLCFSCPMQGDRKVLSWEYAQNQGSADFVLRNLEEHQCVVFETSRKRQLLFVWRAQLLAPEDFRRPALPVLVTQKISAVPERPAEHRYDDRRRERFSSKNNSGCAERGLEENSGEPGATVVSPPTPPENDGVGPSEASALTV